jgi:glycosyltransferase involved in cell wall biosynthesis
MSTASPVRAVSACFPCYNDVHTIERMVRTVAGTLAPLVDEFEVVVVDDGSSDGSVALLQRLEDELSWLRVVVHEHNRGYGGALISAFSAARLPWIFYTDGDGQYDPGEVGQLIGAAGPGTELVQGWKLARGDVWYRRLIGRLYHRTVKVMFRLPVRDTDCDFRLFRRELLDRAPLTRTSGVICVEMMRRFADVGATTVEVPVHHYPRPHGRSQFFRLPHLARMGRQLVQLWWELVITDRRRRPGGRGRSSVGAGG